MTARVHSLSVFACALFALLSVCPSAAAVGTTRDDVGYTTLFNELGGVNVPNGAGVNVTQVEAPLTMFDFFVDTTNTEFSSKTITSKNSPFSNSTHATTVGQYFYGTSTSIAPGITKIDVYNANNWPSVSILKTGTSSDPVASTNFSRVANHSWDGYIGGNATDTFNLDPLERLDYLVNRDQYVNVAAIPNSNGAAAPLVYGGFNTIAVGVTSLRDVSGTLGFAGSIYTAGRARPDLVAPASATSYATPIVSGAAADLIGYMHTAALTKSLGSQIVSALVNVNNPTGIVYDGETVQVIRSTLMAGSARIAFNSDGSAVVNYRALGTTSNGLDQEYGAGQVDIRNSYRIVNAGEKHAGVNLGTTGFDYATANVTGLNATIGNYSFTGDWTGQTFTASLVWNAAINMALVKSGNYLTAATLSHLNLTLTDTTLNSTVASSVSSVENTQNIFTTLVQGHSYQLSVTSGQAGAISSLPYGLAWSGQTTLGWSGTGPNGGNWALNGTNWFNGSTTGTYIDGEHVEFTDAGQINDIPHSMAVISIPSAVAPASVHVNNSSVNYSFSGAAISGNTGLVKDGNGLLTLGSANTYTGNTYVNGGTLSLTADNAIPAATSTNSAVLSVAGGALVKLNASNIILHKLTGSGTVDLGTGSLTLGTNVPSGGSSDGILATFIGSGSLIKTGINGISLSSASTFSGPVLLNSGVLGVYVDGALGSAAGGTTVASGATLVIYSPYGMTYSTAEPVTINGAGYDPGSGAEGALYSSNVANTNAVNAFFGPVTAASSSTINVDPTTTLLLAGGINIATSSTLTKVGTGTLTVSGPQTHGSNAVLSNSAGTVNLNSNGGSQLNSTTSGASTVTNFGAAQSLLGITLSNGATLNVVTGNSTAANFTLATGGANSATVNTNGNQLSISGANGAISWEAGVTMIVQGTAGGSFSLALGPGSKTFVSAVAPTLQINSGASVSADATYSDPFSDWHFTNQRINIVNNSTTGLNVNAGSASAGNIDGLGNTTVAAGAALTANHIIQNSLAIGAGATVTINPSNPSAYVPPGNVTVPSGSSTGTSILGSLSIAADGKLDLKNNNLVINYTGSSPVDDIRQAIQSAFTGGTWQGTGLTSSMMNLDPLQVQFALVYDENSNRGANAFNSTTNLFEGTPVNSQSVLVKYTWVDDLNMDGLVNFDDLQQFNLNYVIGGTGHTYAQGDLNYDGVVDFDDAQQFKLHFLSDSLAHLPEPSTFVLGFLGLAGLLALRLRRK